MKRLRTRTRRPHYCARLTALRGECDLSAPAAIWIIGRDACDLSLAPCSTHLTTRQRASSTPINGAIRSLSADQRNLLRAHFIDGATFDQLAVMYGMHKVTVWRKIANARDSVVEATRKAMDRETAIPASDFDSILRAVFIARSTSAFRRAKARVGERAWSKRWGRPLCS
jgi:DNA-directed RNA polymerase specialized sigma24 family protein